MTTESQSTTTKLEGSEPTLELCAPCVNCWHANPHDGPAGTVDDACTDTGCNCGYYIPVSPSGQAWHKWFDRLGASATTEVVNATANLVIEEKEISARVSANGVPTVDQCGVCDEYAHKNYSAYKLCNNCWRAMPWREDGRVFEHKPYPYTCAADNEIMVTPAAATVAPQQSEDDAEDRAWEHQSTINAIAYEFMRLFNFTTKDGKTFDEMRPFFDAAREIITRTFPVLYGTEVVAPAPSAAIQDETDDLVDEVQHRMDQVVEAAVEWHQAGREGGEWFEAAEKLGAAIDSLLELRDEPGNMPRRWCSVHNREEFKYESLDHELRAIAVPAPPAAVQDDRCKCGLDKDDPIHWFSTDWQPMHKFTPRPTALNLSSRARKAAEEWFVRRGEKYPEAQPAIDELTAIIERCLSEGEA